ncbi:MAG: glycoside hydrolase family 38 C-terminal domain-containing protein [bacterium]
MNEFPAWLLKLNRFEPSHFFLSLFLPRYIRRKSAGALPEGMEHLLNTVFFRDDIGNVDTNDDGKPDAFQLPFTNHWFDQRLLKLNAAINGIPVPEDKVYFKAGGKLYPSHRTAEIDFAPGEIVNCYFINTVLPDGIHFLSLHIVLEYVEAAIPPLPIVLRDGKADFAVLPPYAPSELPGRDLSVHFIPHVHYDAEWLQPHEVFKEIGGRNLYEMLRIMDRNEYYTFVIDQCAYLKAFKEEHPDAFYEICRYVKEGRIEPACGMYAEPDTNLPCGESLVRQAAAWQNFAIENFGAPSACGWLIDSFGQCAQLPQILSLAGVRYHVFFREGRKELPSEFLWEGLDGTRILTHWMPLAYSAAFPLVEDHGIAEKRLAAALATLADRATSSEIFCPHGNDHARPQSSAPKFIALWNDNHPSARARFSLPSKFFESLPKDDLKTIKGDFTGVFTGTYSSRIDLKILNRQAEVALMEAERIGMLLSNLMGEPSPSLDDAWELVMFNQFHDIICGCCTDEVARGAEERFRIAIVKAKGCTENALRTLADNIGTEGFRNPLLIFNPIPRERIELATAALYFPPLMKEFRIMDGDAEVPYQVIERRNYADGTVKSVVVAFCISVPALGYKVVEVCEGKPSDFAPLATCGENLIENEVLSVHFHPEAKFIDRIKDKRSGQEFLFFDACEMVLERDGGDLYETVGVGRPLRSRYMKFSFEAAESGPMRSAAVIRGAMRNTRIGQRITLTAGSPRLDIEMKVDFRDEGSRLRMRFPTLTRNSKVTYGVPFGAAERGGGEHAAVNWMDVNIGNRGFAVFNVGVPACAVEKDDVYITLIRGSDRILLHPGGRGGFCLGEHSMRLALFPHDGGWQQAHVPARAEEFLLPLRAVQIRKKQGSGFRVRGSGIKIQDSLLPQFFSLFSLMPQNLILSGYHKTRKDEKAQMIRFYESCGQETVGEIKFGGDVVESYKVNFLEEKIADADVHRAGEKLSLKTRPFEIANYIVKFIAFGDKKNEPQINTD